jgi:hypothetical protein
MLVLSCAAGLALGCSSGISPFGIESMRARWEEREPFAYRVEMQRSCFCPQDMIMPVTIEVVGGIVQRRYYTGTGADIPASYANSFPDVDALFDRLADIAQGDPGRLEITYDPHYGFPSDVLADPVANAIDDEFSLHLRDFVAFAPEARARRTDPAGDGPRP